NMRPKRPSKSGECGVNAAPRTPPWLRPTANPGIRPPVWIASRTKSSGSTPHLAMIPQRHLTGSVFRRTSQCLHETGAAAPKGSKSPDGRPLLTSDYLRLLAVRLLAVLCDYLRLLAIDNVLGAAIITAAACL